MSTTGAVGRCCRIDFKMQSYLICIEGWENDFIPLFLFLAITNPGDGLHYAHRSIDP